MNNTILTAFSNPGSTIVAQWLQRFINPPTVVDIPGSNSTQFTQQGTIAQDDLSRYVHNRNPKHNGRIAVVTFSAGWGFLHALSQSPAAMGLIDTVILLDGLHTRARLEGLEAYVARASYGAPMDPMVLLLHSQIIPPFISSKATNELLMRSAKEHPRALQPPLELRPLPGHFTNPQLYNLPTPSPLNVVRLGNQYGHALYSADPIVDYDNAGNAWRVEYHGDNAAIHIYIAQYVQPRAWATLAERWNGLPPA